MVSRDERFLYIHFTYQENNPKIYGQDNKLLNVQTRRDIENRHLILKHPALSEHLAILHTE